MLSDFRTKFPRVPGDVAALEGCYDELTQRAKDIGMRRPALTSAIGLASGWTGKARDAFDRSCSLYGRVVQRKQQPHSCATRRFSKQS